jgi:LysM repeat protein
MGSDQPVLKNVNIFNRLPARSRFLIPTLAVLAALISGWLAAVGTFAQGRDLPETAFVDGLVGRAQTYNLSCESRSAADWAAFWGQPISETEFLSRLPRSDNPERGYVGDPRGAWGYVPPAAYGVHARPVARLLREYGLQAQAHQGLSWGELRAEIAAGRPVIVWVIGRMWSGTPQEYAPADGKPTTVARYEHTMIVVGYTSRSVQVVDASSGWLQTYPVQAFRDSWAVLGNQAVTGYGPPTPTVDPDQRTYTVRQGEYLRKLARRFNTTWEELARLNALAYPYIIYPGQVLRLPQAGGDRAPTPTRTPEPTATRRAPTPTPLPTATPAASPGASRVYVVQPGDHLRAIARRLGLDWLALARLNGLLPPYILYPGQELALLAGDAPGAATPTAAEPGRPPAEGGKTYTVRQGDYLMAIARRFELDWRALARRNSIQYPYRLYPGQVLTLP